MEFEMFNFVDASLYRAVMVLIQGATLVLGLASLLFLLTCLVCVACACYEEMARHARRRLKRDRPLPELVDLLVSFSRHDLSPE